MSISFSSLRNPSRLSLLNRAVLSSPSARPLLLRPRPAPPPPPPPPHLIVPRKTLTSTTTVYRPPPTPGMASADGIPKEDIGHQAQNLTNGTVKLNNWSTPGPAAYDFRSDVVTTPTANMLSAIASTTLLDDVFRQDPTTLSLESFMASLTGKASALLVLSGTMGNQVALRTHLLGPPHGVLTDHRSHIVRWEAGGVSSLTGATVVPVTPSNGRYLSLEDVRRHAVVGSDVHACPTKVVSLEDTLDGSVTPLAEIQAIGAWARERGIRVHLDGARLWEAVAAGSGSLEDHCAAVDSVSLCFSKGLGAPIGSVLVGNEAFVERARWVRKSIGGGLRQAGVVSAAARVAVEETFLAGKLAAGHGVARRIADLWTGLGGRLTQPVETNMVWLDLEAAGVGVEEWIELGEKAGLRVMGGRLVVHYQIGEDALQRLERLARKVLKGEEELDGRVEYDPVSLRIKVE